MTRLTPIPFPVLLRRMQREVELSNAIFDLPARKWFVPDDTLDFSAQHYSQRASTPLGPAAGPHTQLAQNIVLSWLAGGRIIELKTVQVNDALSIPRPCIHVPNVGYNIEWSQELRVEESLAEYAKAVYLIEILKATRAFGALERAAGFAGGFDTVYDISVGYDLDGIKSEKITGFLRSMRNATFQFDDLRKQLTGDLSEFRDIELPQSISGCVTLSTFHGCPASQIESISRYLLEEIGVNVVIKFNPTLLGFDAVKELLLGRMGYHHLSLSSEAFEQDLQYEDALELLCCLQATAEEAGLAAGAKFTNTLVVANNPEFFPTNAAPYMYLSGPPLHVIAMNLMQRFREDAGFDFPISFSAGIDQKNFPAAVACGMAPVTTCTDLLRQGGYARLPRYLNSLADEMRRINTTRLDAYVLAARGRGSEAVEEALRCAGAAIWNREGERLKSIAQTKPDDLPPALQEAAAEAGLGGEELLLHATRIAGRLNGRDIVPLLAEDHRYWAESNENKPRRIAKTLSLYDCINCDLCIPVCPNDAMFAYETTPASEQTERITLRTCGAIDRAPGDGFVIRERHQLAVACDACNECSNCDVYCPEDQAPFQVKERVFVTLDAFRASPGKDGFCRAGGLLLARLNGEEMSFEPDFIHNRAALRGNGFEIDMTLEPLSVAGARLTGSKEVRFDSAWLWRMKTAWESIFNSSKPNMVNPDPQRPQRNA